jgi:hypothetical protein
MKTEQIGVSSANALVVGNPHETIELWYLHPSKERHDKNDKTIGNIYVRIRSPEPKGNGLRQTYVCVRYPELLSAHDRSDNRKTAVICILAMFNVKHSSTHFLKS